MNLQTWLASKNIDCQSLTAELQTALQSQFESEQQKVTAEGDGKYQLGTSEIPKQQKPVTEAIVLSDDCPQRFIA